MNKQIISIIILSVVLILLIFVGINLYNKMSDEYTLPTKTSETTKDATVAETKEIITAKDFSITDKDQNTVKLSDFFGKPLVVNFWATWCYPCTSEMPHFDEAYKEYGDEITFLMVNVGDSHADAYKYAQSKGYSFPVYHDSTYSATYAYGVSAIPKTLFINADGKLIETVTGTLSEKMLESYIGKIK